MRSNKLKNQVISSSTEIKFTIINSSLEATINSLNGKIENKQNDIATLDSKVSQLQKELNSKQKIISYLYLVKITLILIHYPILETRILH